MRGMLDAAKKIWLNIFWSDTWLVGVLHAISRAKYFPGVVNSPGEVRLPEVRGSCGGKCQALGA
jgi:hypothetical protein